MAYLDHAASTPMVPAAVDAMTARLGVVGNPSSLHAAGRDARRIVEEAREAVADALGARPTEVVFTGGGTEADNLAVKGIYFARRSEDARRRRVLVSSVEHHAVLDAAGWLAEHMGAEAIYLPVDELGRVHPETLRGVIAEDPGSVAVVSVMWANNEVGTVQPVAELAAVAHEYAVPFHTDAVQAVGQLPVRFADSGVDALTITGHKFGGPLGAGALIVGREVPCAPLLHGGGQERDVRSGTLDAPAIAALGVAATLAAAEQPGRAAHMSSLRDRLVAAVFDAVPDAILNGDSRTSLDARLPGNGHFSFPGCAGDALLMLLDARGIECSTGSACSAGVARASHVLLAMGVEDELGRSSLRFSLGHTSTTEDVRALADAIGPCVERARRATVTAGS